MSEQEPNESPTNATDTGAEPVAGEGDALAAITAERDKLKDQLLRTAADFDNFRKRARKDVEDVERRAKESVLSEVLTVIDNLERAGLALFVDVRVGDALETLASEAGPIDLVLLDGAKTLYRPILSLLEPSLAENALIVSDNMAMTDVVAEFAAYVRDPANGYLACALPALGGGLEVALRVTRGA